MDDRRTRARGDRGASAPEYALIIGLVAVAAIVSLRMLGGSSDASFVAASDAITETPASSGGGATPTPSPIPAAPIPLPAPTTTTTTTTTATTTTTVPSTPTTAPAPSAPPTTVAPPLVLGTSTTAMTSSASLQNKNKWNAVATVSPADAAGRPIEGNAAVLLRIVTTTRDSRDRIEETVRTTVVNVIGGSATVTDKNLNTGSNGQTAVVSVRYEVVEVQQWNVSSPAGLWDGRSASTTVNAP